MASDGCPVLPRTAARQGGHHRGSSAVLQTGHVESERIYAEMVWSLLLMFTGLFITVTEAQARTADIGSCRVRHPARILPTIGSCRVRHPARISLEHTTIWLTTDMMSSGGQFRHCWLQGLLPGRRAADHHPARDRHALDVAVTPVTKERRFRPHSLQYGSH
jgi:hypothetical protein